MLDSLKEYQSLARDFKAFDASLRIERPDDVSEWLKEVVEWERKAPVTTPTPYDIPEDSEYHRSLLSLQLLTFMTRTYHEQCQAPVGT